jgi:hypothetical protein
MVHNKPVYFIMTPIGDLEAPHWRWIESMPDGCTVIVLALRLRDMAARINHGGDLVNLSGVPMTMADIAGILGYQFSKVSYAMMLLHSQGVLDGGDEDGWTVIDPVVRQHCNRLLPALTAAKILPPLKLEAEPQTETKDERKKRLSRSRKAKFDFRQRWGGEPEEIIYVHKSVTGDVTAAVTNNGNAVVTPDGQQPDITDKLSVTKPYNKPNKTAADCSDAACSVTRLQMIENLDPSVKEAIAALPVKFHAEARNVAIESESDTEVLVSNINLLGSRLLSPKLSPKNPGGWLREAIQKDYAATERARRSSEDEARIKSAAKRQQQAEDDDRKRLAELKRQSALLQLFETLSEEVRSEIEAEAAERCRNMGADIPMIAKAAVLDIVEVRYVGCAADSA